MDKHILDSASVIASALSRLSKDEEKTALTIALRVAKLSRASVEEGRPIEPKRVPVPADAFWAAALAAGCIKVGCTRGQKGSKQMLCGPGVDPSK